MRLQPRQDLDVLGVVQLDGIAERAICEDTVAPTLLWSKELDAGILHGLLGSQFLRRQTHIPLGTSR